MGAARLKAAAGPDHARRRAGNASGRRRRRAAAQGIYCANCGRKGEDGRRPRHCPGCGHAQGYGKRAVSGWRYLAHAITGPVSGLVVCAKYRRADRGAAPARLAISPAVTGAHATFAAADYSIYGQCYGMIGGLLW